MVSPTFLFMILLTMEFAICCCGGDSSFDCTPREKKALLKFKASLLDPSKRLSSWDDHKDCCAWDGVKCDKTTGHVSGLDLRNNNPYTPNMLLQGNKLDSSLLELKYLSYLDLSYNDFKLSPIPAFLGSMKHLQYLNLSTASFGGVVPRDLGNLPNLHTLDLTGPGLIANDLMWASNLTSLENLDLSYIDLSQIKNLVKVLNMLPTLSWLSLSGSSLDNTNLAHTCVNSTLITRIKYLDLSWNSFEGEFPCFLQNITSLTVLHLSGNRYNASDPRRLSLRNLVDIYLGNNLLHHNVDWISEFLRDKCHLKSLYLDNNQFYGKVSGLLKNLSECWIDKLETLSLSNNKFVGNLPEEVGELKRLKYLDLSHNTFNGSIPWSFGKLSSLTELNIGYNQLSGEILMSLGQLSNLESIDISFNFFNDTLLEAQFANLSKLKVLWAGSNLFKYKVGLDWVPPFQLEKLSLQSCKIGGQFPQWLQNQKALISMDLSNCGISGTLPSWLQYINMTTLYLSKNSIEGPIPKLSSSITYLDLSNNMINPLPRNIGHMMPLLVYFGLAKNFINGSIPNSLCKMKALIFLDLSNNYLSDWIGKYLTDLKFLILRNNEFYGVIPSDFCQLSQLQVMDFAHNKLTENIPHCIGNFSSMVMKNISDNGTWSGENLGQVMKGVEQEFTASLVYVVNLDLSNNNLVGEIPSELTNLSGLIGLNLSHNHLEGKIPAKIGDLRSLISLDLSSNNLFGTIPDSLSDLSFLSHLNLSHNNLPGRIPTGNQLQTLDDPSIYDGNPELCGALLHKKCIDDEAPNVESHAATSEDDRAEKIYLYGVIISGVAIGFWGVIGVLIFKRSWRQAYFQFIEVGVGKMLGW
ncbi:hypothetical protein BUALT_Bualt16G0089400 [Buddleja alternifolia]|uniref:Leucine-rich repeat-containing N-terminal plant-type domain-containing protein n=1 Tax=Buddleja alternifolia TaxID=168488 RepID=A0AAV6WGS4_9LAMI|nr:hypothetical protein BUALT_Bualt16G0089400 [Buddleja alternifolia]